MSDEETGDEDGLWKLVGNAFCAFPKARWAAFCAVHGAGSFHRLGPLRPQHRAVSLPVAYAAGGRRSNWAGDW